MVEFKGKGFWVVIKRGGEIKEWGELLECVGGKFLVLEMGEDGRFKWGDVLSVLGE